VGLDLEDVGLDDIHDFPALPALEREKRCPTGVLVADESPIETGQEVEDVNECREEVDEADPPEPIELVGLACIEHANGSADEIARDEKCSEGHSIDPVVGPNREFPHIDASIVDRLAAALAIRLRFVSRAGVLIFSLK